MQGQLMPTSAAAVTIMGDKKEQHEEAGAYVFADTRQLSLLQRKERVLEWAFQNIDSMAATDTGDSSGGESNEY